MPAEGSLEPCDQKLHSTKLTVYWLEDRIKQHQSMTGGNLMQHSLDGWSWKFGHLFFAEQSLFYVGY